MNDKSESAAIHAVFGAGAQDVSVSSTKSTMGHLIAAAGAVEVAMCALAIERGEMPVNANLRERDPDCDLNLVVGAPRKQRVRMTLVQLVRLRRLQQLRRAASSGRSRREPRLSDGRHHGREVLITGTGAVCASGMEPADILAALRDGRSSIAPDPAMGHDRLAGEVAAEMPDFNPRALVEDRKLHKLIRRTDMFGLYAASPRDRQRGLHRAPRHAGCGRGRGVFRPQRRLRRLGRRRLQLTVRILSADDASRTTICDAFGRELGSAVNPMWLLRTLPNNVLCHVGIKYDLKGTNACITNHSVGGTLAVIEAAEALRQGEADRAVAVGHDAPIEPQMVLYYHQCGLLARDAMRPFDRRARRQRVRRGRRARWCSRPSAPPPSATRPCWARCWAAAMRARRRPARDPRRRRRRRARHHGRARRRRARARDVGMIVAHGNGTRAIGRVGSGGDARRASAADANAPPVTAFKWAIGHLIAAAGIIEAVHRARRAARAASCPASRR